MPLNKLYQYCEGASFLEIESMFSGIVSILSATELISPAPRALSLELHTPVPPRSNFLAIKIYGPHTF
jgi:hypothetical protein